ncbi:hypothetical protein JYG23_00130 [Sedimentibacter sp. zth1]|uniref:hypothetical protein n=1 Tax=Sedimentibacter sp. zth1 TaxID=2816908 RepID=UPI001A91C6DF|nr:hypothetical protein [Sedimentibacter sp. zth1]QSX05915.1 hypothetical protein JYG23_00130 [Sedimentibacter sp. zth1]
MKKKSIGLIGIIFGGFLLSLELYLTKIAQLIDKTSGSYYTSVWKYAGMFPCSIALIITIVLIFYSIYIYFTYKDD